MTTAQEYKRLRGKGWAALQAWRAARASAAFERLESLGLVRLRVEPDDAADIKDLEGDMFNPAATGLSPSRCERERRKYREQIERDCVWGIIGEYRLGEDAPWQQGGSVWGFVGDVSDTGYDSDIKNEAIDALREAIRNRCRCCKGSGERAAAHA